MRPDDALTEKVIGACIEVHRHLGPGLLEAMYQECVCCELTARGIGFEREVLVPITYKGIALNSSYRLDVLVEDRLILELKAVEGLLPVHYAQLRTYLKTTRFEVGLLVNFNVMLLRHGLRRLTDPQKENVPPPGSLPPASP
jgi:GxxExxY protein